MQGWFIHFAIRSLLVSVAPSVVVLYTSFLETNGPVFTGGFGLNSYARVVGEISRAVINSFMFAGIAVLLITLVSGMISYIIVRREGRTAGALDTILMVPYLVPGIVMAIGFVTTFNRWPVDLVATAAIIILVVFIRRLPYGVRSTTASLRQVKPSIEEAAASLGASTGERIPAGNYAFDHARVDCRSDDELHYRDQRTVLHSDTVHRQDDNHAGAHLRIGARRRVRYCRCVIHAPVAQYRHLRLCRIQNQSRK